MIKKAIITTAGEGTRMLPATKEQPKEMLPLFDKTVNGGVCVKPLLQIVFEQLRKFGICDFCFITGKGKKSIEEHFTQDHTFLQSLKERGKIELAEELENFYLMLDFSNIFWRYQPRPAGFGDAVLLANPYIQNEPFLVYAGDTYIQTVDNSCLKRIVSVFEEYKPEAVFLVFEVDNPKMYGVVDGEEIESGVYRVGRVIEKPEEPVSNLAILPVYIFNPIIFSALRSIDLGKDNEKQLTDGIQKIIDWGHEVLAVKLDKNDKRLDIGNPEFYSEAISFSAKWAGIKNE